MPICIYLAFYYTDEDTVECKFYLKGYRKLEVVTTIEIDTTWRSVNLTFGEGRVHVKTERLRMHGEMCTQEVCRHMSFEWLINKITVVKCIGLKTPSIYEIGVQLILELILSAVDVDTHTCI